MNEEILDLLSQIQLHDNSTRSRQVVSFGSPSRSVLVASSPKVHKSPSEKGSFRTGSKATCTAVHEKMVCLVVSMTAPKLRQTLLEMRKGVLDSTMAILTRNRSTGTRIARWQGTMLLFPNRNDMLTLRSWISGRIAAGTLQRNSSSWCCPMAV